MSQNKTSEGAIQQGSNELGTHSYDPAEKLSSTVDANFRAPDELLKAQSLANILDTAIKIPFINFRLGLDSLVGLIPGIGDTVMLLASMRIVHLGHKLGVPKSIKTKMVRNAAIDYGLGFVPIVGDVIDLFFKANRRNVHLMEKWWVAENKQQIEALTRQQYEQWQKQQDIEN